MKMCTTQKGLHRDLPTGAWSCGNRIKAWWATSSNRQDVGQLLAHSMKQSCQSCWQVQQQTFESCAHQSSRRGFRCLQHWNCTSQGRIPTRPKRYSTLSINNALYCTACLQKTMNSCTLCHFRRHGLQRTLPTQGAIIQRATDVAQAIRMNTQVRP